MFFKFNFSPFVDCLQLRMVKGVLKIYKNTLHIFMRELVVRPWKNSYLAFRNHFHGPWTGSAGHSIHVRMWSVKCTCAGGRWSSTWIASLSGWPSRVWSPTRPSTPWWALLQPDQARILYPFHQSWGVSSVWGPTRPSTPWWAPLPPDQTRIFIIPSISLVVSRVCRPTRPSTPWWAPLQPDQARIFIIPSFSLGVSRVWRPTRPSTPWWAPLPPDQARIHYPFPSISLVVSRVCRPTRPSTPWWAPLVSSTAARSGKSSSSPPSVLWFPGSESSPGLSPFYLDERGRIATHFFSRTQSVHGYSDMPPVGTGAEAAGSV